MHLTKRARRALPKSDPRHWPPPNADRLVLTIGSRRLIRKASAAGLRNNARLKHLVRAGRISADGRDGKGPRPVRLLQATVAWFESRALRAKYQLHADCPNRHGAPKYGYVTCGGGCLIRAYRFPRPVRRSQW